MTTAGLPTRAAFTDLPENHLVRVLAEQHRRVRELIDDVRRCEHGVRRTGFDQLRLLLAIHESAEQTLLRPVSRAALGAPATEGLTAEETGLANAMSFLEAIQDVDGDDFAARFDELAGAVVAHAEREEAEEFPGVVQHGEQTELVAKGALVRVAEDWAPVRPRLGRPESDSLRTFGEFAELVDRSRANFRRLM